MTVVGVAMPSSEDRLPRWLVGCWDHALGAERTVQRWVVGGPGVLFGAVWTIRDTTLVRLDVMRLSVADESLRLDVIPLTGPPARLHAPLTIGARTLKFEAADGTSRLRLDDSGRRVACASVLNPATRLVAAAMHRLHEADERAVVAGDADALEQLWTDDIVALPPGSAPNVGRAGNAAGLRRSLAESRDVITEAYRLQVDEMHLIGDHAIEWGSYEGRVRPRNDSAVVVVSGAMLRVIRQRADGEWRVARTMFTAQ